MPQYTQPTENYIDNISFSDFLGGKNLRPQTLKQRSYSSLLLYSQYWDTMYVCSEQLKDYESSLSLSLHPSDVNQVTGVDTRLQAAKVMKKMRNMLGLESSLMITELRTPRAANERDSARPMQPRTTEV